MGKTYKHEDDNSENIHNKRKHKQQNRHSKNNTNELTDALLDNYYTNKNDKLFRNVSGDFYKNLDT